MANDTSASIITLHQPKAQTPAERARAYRLRKKGKAPQGVTLRPVTPGVVSPAPAAVTPVTPSRVAKPVTASRRQIAPTC